MNLAERDAALEQAILRDDSRGVAAAIAAGADVNGAGAQGVTPLILAVGKLKPAATAELLRHRADTAQRDADGDNAVTLAVAAYQRNPQLLALILNAGGDPNTRRSDGDPVSVRFMNDFDMTALHMLVKAGADVNARDRSDRPLVVKYGLSEDWDAVWTLLELGARYDYPDEPLTMVDVFATPKATPRDSPLWPSKEKAWQFLCRHGLPLPPLEPGRPCK